MEAEAPGAPDATLILWPTTSQPDAGGAEVAAPESLTREGPLLGWRTPDAEDAAAAAWRALLAAAALSAGKDCPTEDEQPKTNRKLANLAALFRGRALAEPKKRVRAGPASKTPAL